MKEMIILRMEDAHKEIPIDKFVGLKSKTNSMLLNDDKEFNTRKGINMATEFNEFKHPLSKKVIRHKMKRIKSKNLNKALF